MSPTFPIAPPPINPKVKERITWGYALMLASLFVPPTFIAALILAYFTREDARGSDLKEHLDWQIRTLWISLTLSLLGLLLTLFGIGLVILLGSVIWFIYRTLRGWIALADGKPLYRQ